MNRQCGSYLSRRLASIVSRHAVSTERGASIVTVMAFMFVLVLATASMTTVSLAAQRTSAAGVAAAQARANANSGIEAVAVYLQKNPELITESNLPTALDESIAPGTDGPDDKTFFQISDFHFHTGTPNTITLTSTGYSDAARAEETASHVEATFALTAGKQAAPAQTGGKAVLAGTGSIEAAMFAPNVNAAVGSYWDINCDGQDKVQGYLTPRSVWLTNGCNSMGPITAGGIVSVDRNSTSGEVHGDVSAGSYVSLLNSPKVEGNITAGGRIRFDNNRGDGYVKGSLSSKLYIDLVNSAVVDGSVTAGGYVTVDNNRGTGYVNGDISSGSFVTLTNGADIRGSVVASGPISSDRGTIRGPVLSGSSITMTNGVVISGGDSQGDLSAVTAVDFSGTTNGSIRSGAATTVGRTGNGTVVRGSVSAGGAFSSQNNAQVVGSVSTRGTASLNGGAYGGVYALGDITGSNRPTVTGDVQTNGALRMDGGRIEGTVYASYLSCSNGTVITGDVYAKTAPSTGNNACKIQGNIHVIANLPANPASDIPAQNPVSAPTPATPAEPAPVTTADVDAAFPMASIRSTADALDVWRQNGYTVRTMNKAQLQSMLKNGTPAEKTLVVYKTDPGDGNTPDLPSWDASKNTVTLNNDLAIMSDSGMSLTYNWTFTSSDPTNPFNLYFIVPEDANPSGNRDSATGALLSPAGNNQQQISLNANNVDGVHLFLYTHGTLNWQNRTAMAGGVQVGFWAPGQTNNHAAVTIVPEMPAPWLEPVVTPGGGTSGSGDPEEDQSGTPEIVPVPTSRRTL